MSVAWRSEEAALSDVAIRLTVTGEQMRPRGDLKVEPRVVSTINTIWSTEESITRREVIS